MWPDQFLQFVGINIMHFATLRILRINDTNQRNNKEVVLSRSFNKLDLLPTRHHWQNIVWMELDVSSSIDAEGVF